jgi:hypothetical protein
LTRQNFVGNGFNAAMAPSGVSRGLIPKDVRKVGKPKIFHDPEEVAAARLVMVDAPDSHAQVSNRLRFKFSPAQMPLLLSIRRRHSQQGCCQSCLFRPESGLVSVQSRVIQVSKFEHRIMSAL